MKKAQLSINTVIMVIIALVVLTAVMLFFTGQFAGFSEDVDALDQTSTASSAGCQLACNIEKSGAGTPYTNKVCKNECDQNGCEDLVVSLSNCPQDTAAEEGCVRGTDDDDDGVDRCDDSNDQNAAIA
tara:strand:+ start:328 stop:711 length:384 start_codon:yes stop_codon:yes gene_type:complete